MPQEIELKFSIKKQAMIAFRQHPLIVNVECQQQYLENEYFDTSDERLKQQGSVLRLRSSGTDCVQTLKTKGANRGGLHQCHEWEYDCPNGQLDLTAFPDDALPLGMTVNQLESRFSTHFERSSWLLTYQQSQIAVVLDRGVVLTQDAEDTISEVELELKSGQLSDLLSLAGELTQTLPLVLSDISKSERGHRLLHPSADIKVALPNIAAEQSMESAFYTLFGYELESLQRQWDAFWYSQEWRHIQGILVTLGNLQTELEWFADLLPTRQLQLVSGWLCWLEQAIKPLVSWWPACFALSQEAQSEPDNLAMSLQQSKARRALDGIESLATNPRFGATLLSLTQWLSVYAWREEQSHRHHQAAQDPVSQGFDRSLSSAWQAVKPENFVGSTSYALSQYPAVHRLLMLCQYFDRFYGHDLRNYQSELQALEDNLSKLSAMDVVSRLHEWLNDLPMEQQASVSSWRRSQTVLLRDIKQLAHRLFQSRDMSMEI